MEERKILLKEKRLEQQQAQNGTAESREGSENWRRDLNKIWRNRGDSVSSRRENGERIELIKTVQL